jgi:glyoxylase-like metal-dependent hydrolase (beta-lactamase superfamily II)
MVGEAAHDLRRNVVYNLGPGVTRVRAPNSSAMTASGTNSYLVGTSDVVAIDPGPDDPGHIGRLLELADGRLRYVLVTHSHSDHAPGARPLADAADVPLLAYGFGEKFLPDGELRGGDVVAVPGFRIVAVHTPGHASDHLCFLADAEDERSIERVCFSGDHILGGSSVAIMPPDGSMNAYLESLERLQSLDRPITMIAPGHGEAIDDPGRIIRNYIDHRLTRERLVLEALTEEPRTPAELVPDIYRALADELVWAAAATVWAHLRKLGEEGRAESDLPDEPEARWRLVSGVGG